MARIGVGNPTGLTHKDHERAVKIRAVREQLKLGAPPTTRFGSDPIRPGPGQKAPGAATPVKQIDAPRQRPTAPLSFSDRLNTRTGKTTPIDDVARADAQQQVRGLETKGRSLRSQEDTIRLLRAYGILRAPGQVVDGSTPARKPDRGGTGLLAALHGLPILGKPIASVGDYLTTGGGAIGKALESGAGDAINFAADHLNLGKSPFGAIPGDRQSTSVEAMKRIGKDALDIPIQTVPALYQIGRAGVEAGTGNLKPAEQLGRGILDNSAVGNLVQGNVKGAERIALQHPLDAALELSGARAVLGRGAGTAMRSGLIGKRAAGIASTARPDATLLGNVHEPRHYSPDLTVKGLQKLNEGIQRRTGVNVAHMQLGAGKDPNVITGARAVRTARRRMRETAGANEIMRREGRDAMTAAMHQLQPGAKYVGQHADTSAIESIAQRVTHGLRLRRSGTHSDITGLMAQKVARTPATLAGDLKGYRKIVNDSLTRAHGVTDPTAPHYMHPYEQRAAKAMVDSIDNALNDKQFMAHPQGHFAAAEAYNRLRNEIDSVKKDLGLLTPGQEAARQVPALQVHAGAELKNAEDLPTDVRAARAEFASTSAKLSKEQAAGDPYHLVGGLRRQADDLERRIRGAGYDPAHTYSGWHIGNHAISVEDAANLLHHIDANGAGFVSHNPRMHGRFAYFRPSNVRPTLPFGRRTGHALEHGYADTGWQAMTDDIVGAFGTVDQARSFDRTVRLHGTGEFHGTDSYAQAKSAAEDLNAKNPALKLMPVRLSPLHEAPPGLWDRLNNTLGGVGNVPDHAAYEHAKTLFDEATKEGPGVVTLMPEKVFRDWQELATGGGTPRALRPLQGFTQGFKHTVLPFSTRWFAGNHIEGSLRSLAYGHGPADLWRGHRLLNVAREYDKAHGTDVYRLLRAHAFGGRLYGSHRINTLHRTLDDMRDSRLFPALRLASPIAHKALGLIRPLQEGIFRLNDFLERQATAAAIGAKAQKEIRETAGVWKKAITISDQMLHDYVGSHLVDENKMAEFGRYADEALGRYSKHSPAERAVIQTFLPFWDWYRNSLKFVLHTLPAHHPIKQGLIVATQQAIAKELDQEGQHYGTNLPPWLLGSVKGGQSGDRVDLAHFTPFGAFQDPVATAGDLFAPQYMGTVKALAGKNWKWGDLRGGGKEPGAVLRGISALNQIAQQQVPGYGLAERFAEKGGSPYDDSTLLTPSTKADTEVKGAQIPNKILNPFFPKTPGGKTHGNSLAAQYGITKSSAALKKQYGVGGSNAALKKQYGGG